MFLNVCKQTFYVSHVHISQKVKGVLMWNLQHLCEDSISKRYYKIFCRDVSSVELLNILESEYAMDYECVLVPNMPGFII